jgi:UvrB/uvrC motif
MNFDLNNLLRDWPHEPGQIKVRKILGDDGKEKVQLRIDLGLIQMDTTGRPDGQKPHGCESLLTYHQRRAREKSQLGEALVLTAEECGELQQEGIQYYHRYISLFQLNDFFGVIRDTQRNLDLFKFVSEHAERDDIAASLEQFRPYVMMMNTRAKASIELERENYAGAIRQIERGRDKIVAFYNETGNPEMASKSPEIGFLEEWLEEVRSKRPLTKIELLQREMENAIAREAYERAAELRDAIKAHAKRKSAD